MRNSMHDHFILWHCVLNRSHISHVSAGLTDPRYIILRLHLQNVHSETEDGEDQNHAVEIERENFLDTRLRRVFF